MANFWEKGSSILAWNLNLGRSYLITTVHFFLISGEFAKFKAAIGYMEMGGDDHNKDGKYSFDEFKTVVESHQGLDFVFNIFSQPSQFALTRNTDKKK